MPNLYTTYADLKHEIRAKDAELKELRSRASELERQIQTKFDEDEVDRITVHGTTIHQVRDLSVKQLDRHRLAEWLRANGYEDVISPNAARLKSFLKDEFLTVDEDIGWEPDPSRLPKELRDLIDIGEFKRISTKGGSSA